MGRVVWFYEGYITQEQPFAALITYVHNSHRINLVAFDYNGEPHGFVNVTLAQDATPVNGRRYAMWMPYQKGQAAKTEALEKELKDK